MKKINSIWAPKPVSLFTYKVPSKKTKIAKMNMTWPQAKVKYPKMNPFRDTDRDGVPNFLDCRPFNKKKDGIVSSVTKIAAQAYKAVDKKVGGYLPGGVPSKAEPPKTNSVGVFHPTKPQQSAPPKLTEREIENRFKKMIEKAQKEDEAKIIQSTSLSQTKTGPIISKVLKPLTHDLPVASSIQKETAPEPKGKTLPFIQGETKPKGKTLPFKTREILTAIPKITTLPSVIQKIISKQKNTKPISAYAGIPDSKLSETVPSSKSSIRIIPQIAQELPTDYSPKRQSAVTGKNIPESEYIRNVRDYVAKGALTPQDKATAIQILKEAKAKGVVVKEPLNQPYLQVGGRLIKIPVRTKDKGLYGLPTE